MKAEELLEIEALEYSIEKARPFVHIFCRDHQGNRIHKSFPHRPYFYLREQDIAKTINHLGAILEVKDGYRSIFGDRLKKIIMQFPRNVAAARDTLHSLGIPTFEADTYAFTLRWLIDNQLFYTYPALEANKYPAEIVFPDRSVKLFLDIENIGEEIITISYSTGADINTLATSGSTNVEVYKSEKELLKGFLEKFLSIDPDFIIGWNINYDLKLIFSRMRHYRLDYRQFSPLSSVVIPNEREEPLFKKKKDILIAGREVFDYAEGYGMLYRRGHRIPVFEALDSVSKRHLGYGKLELDMNNLKEIWLSNPDLVIEYNRRDVQLLLDLEHKLGIFDFFNSLRKRTGVRLRDVWFPIRIVDVGLLRTSPYKLPSKRKATDDYSYESKVIREARQGVYDNQMLIDVRSFFLELIKKYNVSPEVLDPNGELIIDEKHRFKKEPKGVLPNLVEKLLVEKERAKEVYKKEPTKEREMKYNNIKFACLAAYGLLGHKPARLYSLPCAEAVGEANRKHILEIKDYLEKEKGIPVTLIDTDGLMFPYYPEKEKREALIAEINSRLEGLSVEEANFFKRVLIVAKCRYKGITDTGQIVAKGVAEIRGDLPIYFANCYEKLTNLILEGKPREEVQAFLREAIQELPSQDLHLLATPKGLRKREYKNSPYHLKAVKRAEKALGLRFNIGDKPWILPTKDQEKWIAIKPSTRLPEEIVVDYEALKEAFVKALEPIFSLLGITREELLAKPDKTKQITLLELFEQ